MTSEGGGGGGSNQPTALLHRLCVHYIGGAGGDHDQVSSHYRSGLQLLTSSASHGHGGQGGEAVVVERIVRKLVRNGRDRDAAKLSSLHTKLAASSKDILRNRASILALLYSLSEDASGNKENQVNFTENSLVLEYLASTSGANILHIQQVKFVSIPDSSPEILQEHSIRTVWISSSAAS